jgi:hypothetical protein
MKVAIHDLFYLLDLSACGQYLLPHSRGPTNVWATRNHHHHRDLSRVEAESIL